MEEIFDRLDLFNTRFLRHSVIAMLESQEALCIFVWRSSDFGVLKGCDLDGVLEDDPGCGNIPDLPVRRCD
jgi:hypothetical protein